MPLPAAQIDAAIAQEIADGHVTGAVVVVGDAENIHYRAAQGWRVLGDVPEPLRADTIFDLASVTKAVATATAVMQLAERGRLALDAPASRYWPGFGQSGKASVTVRQLLAHTSGLPAGVSSPRALRNSASVLADIEAMALLDEPGVQVRYSDISYVVLGELVRRASGVPLDAWCAAQIFAPLGMADTTFRPGRKLAPRLAPTIQRAGQQPGAGVHDPIAAALGGVAGNAGLFSTADDLAQFAQMLLRDGQGRSARILRPDSVATLTLPATPAPAAGTRGWQSAGWALQAPLAANRFRMPWQAGMLEHLGIHRHGPMGGRGYQALRRDPDQSPLSTRQGRCRAAARAGSRGRGEHSAAAVQRRARGPRAGHGGYRGRRHAPAPGNGASP